MHWTSASVEWKECSSGIITSPHSKHRDFPVVLYYHYHYPDDNLVWPLRDSQFHLTSPINLPAGLALDVVQLRTKELAISVSPDFRVQRA